MLQDKKISWLTPNNLVVIPQKAGEVLVLDKVIGIRIKDPDETCAYKHSTCQSFRLIQILKECWLISLLISLKLRDLRKFEGYV